MADLDDMILVQQQQQQQQQQRGGASPAVPQHLRSTSSEQAHELNDTLVGKRKRGTVAALGQDGLEGVDSDRAATSGEAILDNSRSMKRKNGAEVGVVGPSSGQVDLAGTGAEVAGAQTRKRKSLEKLGASSSEQDIAPSAALDASGKKRKALGGGEDGNGVDPAEASDDGTVSQGPALRLRFTRRGNAFAVTKKGMDDGIAVDGVRNGADDDVVGEIQDVNVTGESRHKGNTDSDTRRRSAMDDPSSSDGPAGQGRPQGQSSAAATPDGTTSSLPARSPDSRQLPTREIYSIPSHAGWFSWTKIHNIERYALSEFFDGKSVSKTPKIYKDYRDFIINKYRENTQCSLTFTEVRRMLIGDVNAIRRVFDFLDHWGLINHQVVQETNHQTSGGGQYSANTALEQFPSAVRAAFGSGVSPSAGSNRLIQPDSLTNTSTSVSGFQMETFPTYKNAFVPLQQDDLPVNTSPSETSAPQCICSCCRRDCTRLKFSCQKEHKADFNLCPDCFRIGKYGPGMVARDFIRIEAEPKPVGDQWTTKETVNMLEAIMRYGDNWIQVADHVGTKSKNECVEQFIKLPFGDRFLSDVGTRERASDSEENPKGSAEGPSSQDKLFTGIHMGIESNVAADTKRMTVDRSGALDAPSSTGPGDVESPSPFADASNPLLAQVAFMSAVVGPRVAAAAAQAAIHAIAEEEPAVANLPLLNGHPLSSAFGNEGITTGRHSTESGKETLMPETRHPGTLLQQDESAPHESREKLENGTPAVAQMKAGIGIALGMAAANAKLLADQEEREMEHLMSDIIENQLKRLYAKLEHFEELEQLVEKERFQLEQSRQLLYAHHIQFAESRLYVSRDRHG